MQVVQLMLQHYLLGVGSDQFSHVHLHAFTMCSLNMMKILL